MVSKNDIANFVNKTDFDGKLKQLNKKVTSNKTKRVLVENELKSSNLFLGQSYFNIDGAQLYLILQPILYFENTGWYWKCRILET